MLCGYRLSGGNMSRPRVRLLLFSLSIVFLFALGRIAQTATPAAGTRPENVISVFTEKAQARTIESILTFPARVESKVNAIVRSESDGAVTQIVRPLGSRVHRNEDPSEFIRSAVTNVVHEVVVAARSSLCAATMPATALP